MYLTMIPAESSRNRTSLAPTVMAHHPCAGGVFKSDAWSSKVSELAGRGVTVRELLTFYRASAVGRWAGAAGGWGFGGDLVVV